MTPFDGTPFPALHPSPLTEAEQAVIEQAKADGFMVGSDRRVVLVAAWYRWCRETERPCILGRIGARQAGVKIDGRVVARVPPEGLEKEAARVGASRTSGDHVESQEQ